MSAPAELELLRRAWSADPPAFVADPAFRPARTRFYRWEIRDGEVASIESVRRITDIEEADDRAALARLLPACDGARTVRELAAETALPEDRVSAIAGALYELGVVGDAALLPVPGVAFMRHLASTASPLSYVLSGEVGLHARLMERATSRLLLGWLVESQHFITSAADYLGAAVASAPTVRARMILSDYMAGEFWHGEWVRDGLLAAGIDRALLERAAPLPATAAVSNALRALASRDFYAFVGSMCLHESPSLDGTVEQAEGFWDAIDASGALPTAATAPFREHHLVDCREEHGSVAEQLYADRPAVPADDQVRIRRAVVAHAYTLAAWSREILRFYGSGDGSPVFLLGEQ